MTPRFVRLCLAALLLAAPFGTRAQVPPQGTINPTAGLNPNDPINEIKLPDGTIDDALSLLELLTGRTVLRPAQLQTATYNLKIKGPIPRSEAILALETVLALNNIGVAEQGDRFLVISQMQLVKTTAPEMISGSTFDLPPSGKIAAKIFQLDFLRVQELQQIVQGILSQNIQGFVAFPAANAALITDTVSNLQRVETLLKVVDKPNTAGLVPKFYPLNHATAANVITKINAMLGGTLRQQIGQNTTFSADDRTNQIILFSDPSIYPIFDEIIAKLDTAADPHTRNEVFSLKHATAVKLAPVLIQLIRGQTDASQRTNAQSVRPGQSAALNVNPVVPPPGAPGAPQPPAAPAIISATNGASITEGTSTTNEFSSLMTIVADERSNSIVVSGTATDIVLMKSLIAKLDTVLAQVRIEVVIAEITLDDASTSGISALGLKLDGARLVGFNGGTAGLNISGTGTGTDYASISRLGGPGSLGRSFDLSGIINIGTTPRKTNATILTVPDIVTTHGKKGEIIDGETRPVITGTTSTQTTGSPATTSSVTQQPIGTTLTVTPLIGNDGSVELEITTKLTDVINTVTVDNNTQYVIGNRSTESYITARSGEIYVMGGFRKKSDSKSTNRLGPIPFIGDLFGTRTREKRHQELIFFLRPTILTNTPSDNVPALKRVDELPTRDDVLREIDPSYVPPKESILQKILPK